MRAVLEHLDAKGQLKRCTKRVNAKFELGAVLTHFNNEQPILFTDVDGSSVPVAGGIYGNREIICDLLGTTVQDRIPLLMHAIGNPGKPRMVSNAPVHENVITRGIDLLRMFPIPTSNEFDSGPFLTSGMIAYRDPESGKMQMAVRRFQVNGGNSINALVSPASPHLNKVLAECKKQNKALDVAVILGYDASLLLASQTSSSKYGLDTYEVDSALRGEPIELIRGKTVDVDVPAHAEIVLEGKIKPGAAGPEGPFAELMGYYSVKGVSPLVEITAVTHRNNPIFQHCFPCREEHLAYGMIKEAEAFANLSGMVDVVDVNFTIGGGCRLHVAVSIRKRNQGDGKSVILTVLGGYKDVKHVIVVDDDVNIYDPLDIEFALSSRFQASTDLVVVEGCLGSPLEESYFERGLVDKVGFDCTKPLGERNKEYDRAVIPGFENGVDISKYF